MTNAQTVLSVQADNVSRETPAVTLSALPVFTAIMADKTFEYISLSQKAEKAKTLVADMMYSAGIRSAHLVFNKVSATQTELYSSITASIGMGLLGKKNPDILNKVLTSEKLSKTEAIAKRTVSMGVSAYRASLMQQLDNRAKAELALQVEADRVIKLAKIAELAENQARLAEQARVENVNAIKQVVLAAKKGDNIALKEAQGKALQAKANVVQAEVAAVKAVATSKAEKEKIAHEKLAALASGFTINLRAIIQSNIKRVQDFEAPDFNAVELIKALSAALVILDVKIAVEKKAK